MDSHPKKRKKKKRKTSTEQIRNQSTVTSLAEKAKYSPYKAKANQAPLPKIAIQICLSTKKKKKKPNTEKTKPQTQSKLNPRWDADGHVARRRSLLCRSSSLSTRRRLVTRPPFVIADRCRLQIADRCSTAPVLAARPQGISLSFFLSHSLSLSLKWKIWMWEYCLVSL